MLGKLFAEGGLVLLGSRVGVGVILIGFANTQKCVVMSVASVF